MQVRCHTLSAVARGLAPLDCSTRVRRVTRSVSRDPHPTRCGPEGSARIDGRHPQAVYYACPEDVVALHASIKEKG
jgi:hypothetical protein